MKQNFKVLANGAWKEDQFSLSGVIRYANKTKEPNFLNYLKEIGLKPSQINYDLIKSGAKEESFFTHNKAGERIGEKKYFSLWFVLTALKNRKVEVNEVLEVTKSAKVAKTDKVLKAA